MEEAEAEAGWRRWQVAVEAVAAVVEVVVVVVAGARRSAAVVAGGAPVAAAGGAVGQGPVEIRNPFGSTTTPSGVTREP